MKIQKGHYVPKELITSEAIYEAVVKCFVAAGFKDCRPRYGNFKRMELFAGLSADNQGEISWGDKGSNAKEPLTLQQLFTAENGLQWPDWAESVCTNGESVYFCDDIKFSFIVGSSFGGDVELLASRQPAEKSPLGKYEWGKEYPTSGKRPNLPDDVFVKALFKGTSNWHTLKCGDLVWARFSHFGVIDTRFKPVDEVSGLFNSEVPFAGKLTVEPAQQDSSWHARGELPPVGAVCETKFPDDRWMVCEIICHFKGMAVHVTNDKNVFMDGPELFRPIRTEREKFIDDATAVMQPNALTGTMTLWFGKLFDAGFRGPKVGK